MILQKNDNIEAVIESLGYRGEGVARVDRVPVFVGGALPGERVRAHVILVKKDYAVAKLTEVLSPSPDRTEPRCPYFGRCGGCNLQHIKYGAQLAYKRGAVADALKKIAHISADVGECVPSDSEYGCRNKLSLPVRRGRNGTEVGLFAYNSHRIVETEDCPLQTDAVRAVLPGLRRIAARFAPYDETDGSGELRHFVVRDLGGAVSLTAVLTSRSRGLRDRLADAASAELPGLGELWLNVNRSPGNVIMGGETELVAGSRVPVDIMGMRTYVHPCGFMQVNPSVMRKLYTAVTEQAAAAAPDTIIDAYSGGGTLTALLAPHARSVIGVEIERAASESADELVASLGLTNVRNICGDCASVLPGLLAGVSGGSMVVLDPPRSGCAREVIDAVNACGASRVLYVSCNPSTLARDLALLSNYEPVSVRPFDMFPQTCWVETLVLLSKKKPDSHIVVDVEFGEGEGKISLKDALKRAEGRKPKSKTTYKDIQNYVEENYGFKVHTAYIAEVKRNLGLPMYDAPNAVEELKRPRSHPTEKMVLAIKETLAHFEII